jgi:hypothetical protein
MKTARWFTALGSLVLIGSAIFHTTGYPRLLHRIEKDAIRPPLDGVMKALWLAFSVEFFILAVIAFLAGTMDRGGRIVLLCAATTGACVVLLFHFLGRFPAVYLLAIVTLLFLAGGWLQAKEPEPPSAAKAA